MTGGTLPEHTKGRNMDTVQQWLDTAIEEAGVARQRVQNAAADMPEDWSRQADVVHEAMDEARRALCKGIAKMKDAQAAAAAWADSRQ